MLGAYAMILPPLPHGIWGNAGISALLSFWTATVLLGTLDISLPRGDAVGVSGVLDVLALILFGPMFALLTCVLGVTGASLVRRTIDRPGRVSLALASRLCGLASAYAVLWSTSLLSQRLTALRWIFDFLAIAACVLTELVVVQVIASARTGRSFVRLVRGNMSHQSPLMLAQISSGLLALIGYSVMREWSLVVVVALLLLIRQSYALLLDIRETYRMTVEVLVDVAERSSPDLHGHADRTSKIAREISIACGLSPNEVERISYAALLHDVNVLATGRQSGTRSTSSTDVLAGIPFFHDVISILELCDGSGEGPSGQLSDLLASFIVCLSSDIDAGAHPKLLSAHDGRRVERISSEVPPNLRARASVAARALGYTLNGLA